MTSPEHTANYGQGDASYQAAGQLPGLEKLVDAFYTYMETLPEAREILAMHTGDMGESRKKLAYFLSGWLGGPKRYRETYGSILIPKAHGHLAIGEQERDAWMLCMQKAVHDQPYAGDFKAYLLKQLLVPAEFTRRHCEKSQGAEKS